MCEKKFADKKKAKKKLADKLSASVNKQTVEKEGSREEKKLFTSHFIGSAGARIQCGNNKRARLFCFVLLLFCYFTTTAHNRHAILLVANNRNVFFFLALVIHFIFVSFIRFVFILSVHTNEYDKCSNRVDFFSSECACFFFVSRKRNSFHPSFMKQSTDTSLSNSLTNANNKTTERQKKLSVFPYYTRWR